MAVAIENQPAIIRHILFPCILMRSAEYKTAQMWLRLCLPILLLLQHQKSCHVTNQCLFVCFFAHEAICAHEDPKLFQRDPHLQGVQTWLLYFRRHRILIPWELPTISGRSDTLWFESTKDIGVLPLFGCFPGPSRLHPCLNKKI